MASDQPPQPHGWSDGHASQGGSHPVRRFAHSIDRPTRASRAARGMAILAAVAVGGGLAWSQTIGYYRARRSDEIGQTDVFHRGWPLVYSEHFQPAMSRREAMAPQWLARFFLDGVCSVVGTAAVAFTTVRLASSRLQFRLGTLLLLATAVGGVCAFAPIERRLLTPQDDWGFAWSQPQPHWRTNLFWNWPMTASSTLALVCTIYAAAYFASCGIRTLSRMASSSSRCP